MNKCLGAADMGFLMGLYLGYMKDEEIEDLCHQSKKAEKKMKKNYHKAMDQICDCMDLD